MSAEPFPHLVLDSFAPEATLRAVAAGFDAVAAEAWVRYDDLDERGKRACNRLNAMPAACRDFIAAISSGTAATLCEWAPALKNLCPMPRSMAAGCTRPSGAAFLVFTSTTNGIRKPGLARRLNLIVYCTEGWREEWGGHFELWDRACSRPVKRIAPLWNRAVLFETSAHSFHGRTEPLLATGGFYAIEDIGTSYFNECGGRDLNEEGTTIAMLNH